MLAYALRRILLMVPTLFAIILVNFVIVQAAPGGPVDQLIVQLKGGVNGSIERISGGVSEVLGNATSANQSRSARGINLQFIAEIIKLYGFVNPAPERFS